MTNVLLRDGQWEVERVGGALQQRQRLEGRGCNPGNAQDWWTPAAAEGRRRVSPTQGAWHCQRLDFRLLVSRTDTMRFIVLSYSVYGTLLVAALGNETQIVWVLPGHLISSVSLDDSHFGCNLKINFDLSRFPCPGSLWTCEPGPTPLHWAQLWVCSKESAHSRRNINTCTFWPKDKGKM